MPGPDIGHEAEPFVLTAMTTSLRLTDEARATLGDVVPGIELHSVPYYEEQALRSARAAGPLPNAERATVPQLDDDGWAVLERSTAIVALDLPDGLVERAHRLRWVQLLSAGTDHVDLEAMAARDIVVTSGAGLASGPIADFVMARLVGVWRKFRAIDQNQAEHSWEMVFGRRLKGLTLGVVGLGAIGRATAKRARAFEMRVLANRRSARPGDTDPDVDELFTVDDLDRMLARCDAVVISAAATSETAGMFDRDRIAAIKPGAVLCNVARGSLVDESALIDALVSGHLSAAVIDNTAVEPLPPDSPLWDTPNCHLSPHIAAAVDGHPEALLELTARNLGRFMRSETLVNVVMPP